VWKEFRELRRDMQRRRKLDLFTGGILRRDFDRLTFLRVRVPFFATTFGGGLFVAWLLDNRGRPPSAVAEVTVFTVLAALALATSWFTHRWNERHRPRELRRYCPRCGYDMTQSPHRCPECGLRKMKLPPSQEAWW